MSLPGISAVAACDRLAAIVERSLALEKKVRRTGDDAIRVPLIRYALALLRMRIRPALEDGWHHRDPVHVSMFGGTNSGKSTVLNVLLGRCAAGMSYRARFSQHPVAFRPSRMGDGFLDLYPSRFVGYKRHVDEAPPRQEDHELKAGGYRPALAVCDPSRLTPRAMAPAISVSAVFWDIPDFSTEEAIAYMDAVLDTVAIADLVLMAVTKENYADHRGTLLRSMIAASGVTMRVVANKLEDGSRLLHDIAQKVGADGAGAIPIPASRIHPLPHVVAEGEDERLVLLLRTPEVGPLRNALVVDIASGAELKRKGLAGAVEFLDRRLDAILEPLNGEVAVAAHWASIVERMTRHEFLDRYRSEYLDGEKYVDFNITLVKLMSLLEVPMIGPLISAVSGGLKKISQTLVAGFTRAVKHAFGRPKEAPKRLPEEEVVSAAFGRWRETLANESQVLAQKGQHPAWAQIASVMGSYDFISKTVENLGNSYITFREQMDVVTAERARSIYEVIERNPRLLNTLRGIKLTMDVGMTAMIISSGGLDWTDAVIGPMVAPVQRLILEYGLEKVLDTQKARLKQQQFETLRAVIQKDMVAPVLGLFQGEASPEDLERARRDFAEVKVAALAVAGGPAR